jgi:hypothetical protein
MTDMPEIPEEFKNVEEYLITRMKKFEDILNIKVKRIGMGEEHMWTFPDEDDSVEEKYWGKFYPKEYQVNITPADKDYALETIIKMLANGHSRSKIYFCLRSVLFHKDPWQAEGEFHIRLSTLTV